MLALQTFAYFLACAAMTLLLIFAAYVLTGGH